MSKKRLYRTLALLEGAALIGACVYMAHTWPREQDVLPEIPTDFIQETERDTKHIFELIYDETVPNLYTDGKPLTIDELRWLTLQDLPVEIAEYIFSIRKEHTDPIIEESTLESQEESTEVLETESSSLQESMDVSTEELTTEETIKETIETTPAASIESQETVVPTVPQTIPETVPAPAPETTPQQTTPVSNEHSIAITEQIAGLSQSKVDALRNQLLNQLNFMRQDRGVSNIILNPIVTSAAIVRSQDLPVLFASTRPNGDRGIYVLEQCGGWYAESIQKIKSGKNGGHYFGEILGLVYIDTQDDITEAVTSLINSFKKNDTYQSNIQSTNYHNVGIGITVEQAENYYTVYVSIIFTD